MSQDSNRFLRQLDILPPEKLAASFHEQLEPIQSMIETLKAQLQDLRRTRDLLMPRLLSGNGPALGS